MFFKTKDWYLLDNKIFQKYIKEFFDNNITEIDYDFSDKEKTRIEKINDMFEWITENKKIPSQKEEYYAFFDTLKGIKKGKSTGGVSFSEREENILSSFFKTKYWYLLSDKCFQKYIKEFFDNDITEIDYDFSDKEKINTKIIKETGDIKVSRFEINQLNNIISFFENDAKDISKKLKELQSLKKGTRKTGKLYPLTEKYLEEISINWFNLSVDELYNLFQEKYIEHNAVEEKQKDIIESKSDTKQKNTKQKDIIEPISEKKSKNNIEVISEKKLKNTTEEIPEKKSKPIIKSKSELSQQNYDIHMIILDFSDAIEDDVALSKEFKKKIRSFYRDKDNHKVIMNALIDKVGSEEELMKYII